MLRPTAERLRSSVLAANQYLGSLCHIRVHHCGISVAFSEAMTIEDQAVALAAPFDGLGQVVHARVA